MVKPGMYISDDRYEIIEKIGSGGMADVYKAKCHRLNRYVAVKILKQEYSGDKNFITKFRGEAQSAAGLSHPNIVSVYDVGEDNGLHYIVMELVEGITLKKFIEKKGRLAIKEAVGIAIQIAQGLEAAHNNHIIHRDIKPQNIMISREGKVKVADFGIAKAVSANTYTQNAIGSVHYLSPEQARGGYCDEKSDIYSLGVTLYEMLSGTLPFAGDNNVSVALLHIQSEPRPVRELVPAVQYSLDRIVQKCMQKRPENRYLSASELIVDLKRSITNPEGDFVKLPLNGYVPDNPTRTFTENEVEEIRTTAAKSPVTRFDGHQKAKSRVLKEEEEELDSINSKWEKVVIIGSIIVALALTFGIVYLAGRFFDIGDLFNNQSTTTPTPSVAATPEPTASPTPAPVGTIKMPNLAGYTFEDAEKLLKLKSDDFIVILEKEDYSNKPKGTVIEQYPLADVDVLMDATIKLTISAGQEPLEVPNIIPGMSQEDATQLLISKGFEVEPSYEPNENLPNGSVIRTEPAVGEKVFEGELITLVVSTGQNPTYISMIDILNKTTEEARIALEEVGLVLGDISRDHSNVYADGRIMRQDVAAGEDVLTGTSINIVVSKGVETVEPPSPTPTTEPTTTPEPTPEPTRAPVTYYPITLSTVGKVKPLNEGETAFYYIEIAMLREPVSFLIAEGEISYEEYPQNAFDFKLLKEDYPELKEGAAIVYLYMGDEGRLMDQWLVDLKEVTQ
ncbi:MAG: Stk1 family PASTA domain-containing Ser/Thr kinase [Lachnospiraceae bacterium]|nr:Stk1 family PASTA domain-containing Ser/Thr kinase [Lachnospiraceae bacterium]